MSGAASSPPARRGLLALLPLVGFGLIAALAYVALHRDASKIPSALIGQAAPSLNLPALDPGPGLSDADLRQGHVTIVNVFASWCAPCHAEHEFLMRLAADAGLAAKGVKLIGVAQKDKPEDTRRFLGAGGNPFAKVGVDGDGRAGIDWGVYGVPETYIVAGDGVIAYKFIGPISEAALAEVIRPEIERAAAH